MFVEPRYLHQTFSQDSAGVVRHRLDLSLGDLESATRDEFGSG